MQFLFNILQSRGKFGAIVLMVMGAYGVVEHFIGTPGSDLMASIGLVSAGLSLFGIRAAVPPAPAPTP